MQTAAVEALPAEGLVLVPGPAQVVEAADGIRRFTAVPEGDLGGLATVEVEHRRRVVAGPLAQLGGLLDGDALERRGERCAVQDGQGQMPPARASRVRA